MANKSDAKESVLKYLNQQNRPYSANDITLNLKDFGKTAVQKALDDLSSNGQIIEKTYGKQKVYAPIQKEDVAQELTDQILLELDAKIEEASKILAGKEQELKVIETQLKGLGNQISTECALKEEEELTITISELKSRLESLRNNSKSVSKSDMDNVTKAHDKANLEFKKRKRICTEMMDTILESYPKPKKAFYEDVGVEID